MQWYYYKAKNKQGIVKRGWVQAVDTESFYQQLNRQALYCITYHTYSSGLLPVVKHALSSKQLHVFAMQLGMMLQSGVTISDALVLLSERWEDKRLRTILEGLTEAIAKGNGLSQALKEQGAFFPPFFVHMVACGEASGTLEEVFVELAQYYEERRVQHNQIRSALAYPIFLGVVSLGVLIMMLVFVIPMLGDVYTSYGVLPPFTQALITLSTSLQQGWVVGLVSSLVVGGSILGYSIVKRYPYQSGKLVYQLPIVREVAGMVVVTQVTHALGMLYRSGVTLVDALDKVRGIVRNRYMQKQLERMKETVEKGNHLADAMHDCTVFPDMLVCMVRVGEESGRLDAILEKAHAYYKEELKTTIKQTIGLLEPTLVVGLGLIVGSMALAILQPMYQLTGTIG